MLWLNATDETWPYMRDAVANVMKACALVIYHSLETFEKQNLFIIALESHRLTECETDTLWNNTSVYKFFETF